MHAGVRLISPLNPACPAELGPPQRVLDWARAQGGHLRLTTDPEEAVREAHCVVTDTWVSMGVEANINRQNMLAPYRFDERLMAKAKPGAIFMHCLPAHHAEEETAGVVDGPQSVVR